MQAMHDFSLEKNGYHECNIAYYYLPFVTFSITLLHSFVRPAEQERLFGKFPDFHFRGNLLAFFLLCIFTNTRYLVSTEYMQFNKTSVKRLDLSKAEGNRKPFKKSLLKLGLFI